MKLLWSRRAVRHLTAIREYIERDNPEAAQDIATRIINATAYLAEHPGVGRPGRVQGTRELVITGTAYIIPYRIAGERVELIAVFHGRQKWPKRL